MADALGLGVQPGIPYSVQDGLGTCEYRNDQTLARVEFTKILPAAMAMTPTKTASSYMAAIRSSYSGATVPSGLGPDAWEAFAPSTSGTAQDTIGWTKNGDAFELQVSVRNGSDLHQDSVEAAARLAYTAKS